MVNVAIAGGTSPTLGKSITEAILATGTHKAIILTRPNPTNDSTTPTTKYNAPLIPADYTSPTALTTLLQTHSITHLISVLKPLDPAESLLYHTNLLAAAQSAHTARFIMSDWSMAPPSHTRVAMLAHKNDLHTLGQTHMQTARECGDHVVECATLQNGGFLEYFVQGCGDQGLLNGLVDDLMVDYIDIAGGRLLVPYDTLSGKAVEVSVTSIGDIGRFVAASLDVPVGKMGGHVGMEGARLSFERVAEVVRGLGREVEVEYVTAEKCWGLAEEYDAGFKDKMGKGEFDLELFKKWMVAQMYACMCEGLEGGGVVSSETCDGGMLNYLCQQVQCVEVDEVLKVAWGSDN